MVKRFVELEGATLGVGETARGLVCPACNGGSSHERTFSITRQEHGLVFNCYRGTCEDGRGFLPTSGALLQPVPPKSSTDGLRPYYGTYRPIEQVDREYFLDRFSLAIIPEFAIGLNDNDMYVFEVRDPMSRVRGYLVRQQVWSGIESPRYKLHDYDYNGRSKSRLFMHSQGPTQSWYKPELVSLPLQGRPVVIVEDHMSAMKVAQAGVTGIANIGTFIDDNKVREIAQFKPTEVIIAFDKDATARAFDMGRRWGLAFPRVRIAMLEGDIKDTDPDDVLEVLGL